MTNDLSRTIIDSKFYTYKKKAREKYLLALLVVGLRSSLLEKKMVLYCGTASEPLAMLKVYLEADFQ